MSEKDGIIFKFIQDRFDAMEKKFELLDAKIVEQGKSVLSIEKKVNYAYAFTAGAAAIITLIFNIARSWLSAKKF